MPRITSRFALFVAALSALLLIALALRLFNLTKIPVFADEAIYVRWAQVMRAEPTLRFLPLSDGKQPLYMWTVIPFLKIFKDPLVAGRFLSVLTGVGTALGVGLLSLFLFKSKKGALLATTLCVFSPFMFFFDRMALADSMLAFFAIWFMLFLAVSVRTLRWDFAMLAGFALGGALLTKSPGLFLLLLIPTSAFLVSAPVGKAQRVKAALRVTGLWITTIVIGYGLSQILRLGPNYHMIALRNLDYVFPLSHILENPSDPLIPHIDRALEWIFLIGPVWVLGLSLLGTFNSIKKNSGAVLFVLAYFAFPLLAGSMYAKVFTARYILYTLPPLFVLSSSAALLKGIARKVMIVLVVGFLIHSIWVDHLLITNPVQAPLPQSERSGYFEEWSAGWGIQDAANYIKRELAAHPDQEVVVGTEGYFGTLPDGMQMYLEKVPRVTVYGTGLGFGKVPESLIDAKKAGRKTYFIVNSSRLNKDFDPKGLTLISSFVKPDRQPATHEFVQFGPRETFFFFEVN